MNPNPRTQWWRPAADTGPEDGSERLLASGTAMLDSATPFWALMAFTFILLIAPQSFIPVLAPLRIALLAAALAAMTYFFDRFVHRRPLMRITREMWITICLVGWCIVTLPFSYWPGGSVAFLTNVYFKTLLVFWLLCNVVNSLTRLRLIVWGLSLMAVPLAVSAVRHFIAGDFMHEDMAQGVNRILGYDAPLTENPNDLALTLNLILPLSIALCLGATKTAVRAALLALIGLEVIAVIATFSRAGFLTLAVILGMYLRALFARRGRSGALWVLMLMILVVPLLPSDYLDRLSTITNIQADPTGSAQARWTDTVAAVTYAVQNPVIGAGVGMNALALNEMRGPAWKEIHNVYLQYAVDLGIPGLALFILLLRACIKDVGYVQHRCTRTRTAAELLHLAEGIRFSLIAFAVAAFFHPAGYQFYFYYIAGLAVAAKSICAAQESRPWIDRPACAIP